MAQERHKAINAEQQQTLSKEQYEIHKANTRGEVLDK
jgi:hypothetical protein